MSIELPKDAEGREIPLETKVMYGCGGTARNIVYCALARITKAPATNWRSVMLHIADLIDRGVCENVYDESECGACDNGFECSVCGCRVEDEEHYHVSGTWNF